jgi:hypothetical protein
MKLICPKCKKVVIRDAREKIFKAFMTKRGYKSWCEKYDCYTYLKPITKTNPAPLMRRG